MVKSHLHEADVYYKSDGEQSRQIRKNLTKFYFN